MIEEYHRLVDDLSPSEREALRTEWQEKLANVLEDEGKTLSAAVRLKRTEKRMLDAVRDFFYLFFEQAKISAACSAPLLLRWTPIRTALQSSLAPAMTLRLVNCPQL